MLGHRPLLLLILMAYIFAPGLIAWVIAADGHWLRPYAIWLIIIIIAFTIQFRRTDDDV